MTPEAKQCLDNELRRISWRREIVNLDDEESVNRHRVRNWLNGRNQMILELYDHGKNTQQIADLLGLSYQAVYKQLWRGKRKP